jgi:hypothetical protein
MLRDIEVHLLENAEGVYTLDFLCEHVHAQGVPRLEEEPASDGSARIVLHGFDANRVNDNDVFGQPSRFEELTVLSFRETERNQRIPGRACGTVSGRDGLGYAMEIECPDVPDIGLQVKVSRAQMLELRIRVRTRKQGHGLAEEAESGME